MTLADIIFDGNWPAEIRPAVESLIRAEAWLLPPWCRRLLVNWDAGPSDPDPAAESETHYDYRFGRITFFPPFLDETDEKRRLIVVHELVHIVLGPLTNYARDTLKFLAGDEHQKAQAIVGGHMTELTESVVQDMTLILLGKIPSAEPQT